MFHAKTEIIRLFLAFVGSYIDLSKARLATLGGEGLEAELWSTYGIGPKKGWLIECKQAKSQRLIARFPYRHCARLAYFWRNTESIWGRKYGIDGFHLDLCGTYERIRSDFAPNVPLIVRSAGRCLAITVADQRQNESQEHFEDISAAASELFGAAPAARLFSKLEGDYRSLPSQGIGLWADPVIGAERELGFAYHLMRALGQHSAPAIDRIERYLYVSNSNARPFRMRTYFFHFGKVRSDRNVHDALSLWCKAPLQCVTESGTITVSPSIDPSTHMEVVPMSYPNLKKLAEAAGAACLAEFNELIADADYGRKVHAIPYGNGSAKDPAPSTPRAKPVKKNGDSEILAVQLDLLRAGAQGEDALESAKQSGIAALGLKGKGKKRVIGAIYSRAKGKGRFRKDFLTRLATRGMLTDVVFEELARIFTTFDGKESTVKQLKAAAGI